MSTAQEVAGIDRSAGLEKLKSLLSPYVGVAQWTEEILASPTDARMSFIVCDMPPRTLTLGSALPMAAASVGYDRDEALAAALGEAVERYCGSFLPESRFVLASARELGPEAVRPGRFSLFAPEQYALPGFRFEPFAEDTRVYWTEARTIGSEEKAYLPQQLVYMRYTPEPGLPGEAPIGVGSSSGMALGQSRDEARLGGLFELIERDAVMLCWLNMVAPPRLDWSADERLVELHRRHFAPSAVSYEVFDLSFWCGVPTVLAIHRGDGEGSVRYAMGAASGPTIQSAWDKGVRECFQGVTLLKYLYEGTRDRTFAPDFSDIRTPEDHSRLYLDPGVAEQAAFLESSDEVRDVRDVEPLEGESPAEVIASICSRLESAGTSAYAVDITTPDVAEAGLCAAKVISPELQPIDFGHGERFLGGRRLYEAARELGLRDAPLTIDDLNPFPHPFP